MSKNIYSSEVKWVVVKVKLSNREVSQRVMEYLNYYNEEQSMKNQAAITPVEYGVMAA